MRWEGLNGRYGMARDGMGLMRSAALKQYATIIIPKDMRTKTTIIPRNMRAKTTIDDNNTKG